LLLLLLLLLLCCCIDLPAREVIAHSSLLVGSFEPSSVASGDWPWASLSRRPPKDLPAGEGWQPVLLLLLLLPLLLLLLLCRLPRRGR
jgi:hypothetical protein